MAFVRLLEHVLGWSKLTDLTSIQTSSTRVPSKQLLMPNLISRGRSTLADLGHSMLESSTKPALSQISSTPPVSSNTGDHAAQLTCFRCRVEAMERCLPQYVNKYPFHLVCVCLSLTISANVLFAEYHNTGDGSKTNQRASFSTVLTSSNVASYSISAILGSGYTSWVDSNYA